MKRKLSKAQRKALHDNAMIGVCKWQMMNHRKRVIARRKALHRWGYEGHSPRTVKRKYKHERG